jgi:hypothetical protein
MIRKDLKMLCDTCGTVNPVIDVFAAGTLAKLSCGHKRGELTPKREGTVSIEDLNSQLGWKHFPQLLDPMDRSVLPAFVEHR